jgi:hypothetical protein
MLHRLLPPIVDNRFRGHPAALWLFVPLVFMKLALGTAHMLRADGGAQSVSRMPLDTYPEGAAQNIVALMARMGLEQFLLGALFLVVLLRYRALIPLMYAAMVLHFVGARLVGAMKPLAVAGASGVGNMHLLIAALAAVGLVASLAGRGYTHR